MTDDRTPAAERVGWFQERRVLLERLDRKEGTARADNITVAYRLVGALDEDLLARAAALVAQRHEPLRTVFPGDASPPVARVLPSAPVPVERLCTATEEEAVRTVSAQWLDIQQGPVLRLVHVFCEDGELLVICYAHIVGDGVESVNVLTRELAECYGALTAGDDADLPPLPFGYGEFARRHRTTLDDETRAALLDHWRGRLPPHSPDPPVHLPTLTPGSGTALGTAAVVRVQASEALVRGLPELRGRYRTTTFTLFMAGLLAAVRSLADQPEVGALFAVDVRSRYRASGLIGSFSTLSVLWLPADPDMRLDELAAQVRTRVLEAFVHGALPFDEIIREVYPQWWEDVESPPYVFFSTSAPRPRPWQAPGVEAHPVIPRDHSPRHLHPGLKVVLDTEQTALSCQYAVAAFAPDVVRALLNRTLEAVERLVTRPDSLVRELAGSPD